jgi:hypothetical protein
MTTHADVSGAGQGRSIVYYRGPRIVVTSEYIETAGGRYLIRDLKCISRLYVGAYPARTTALVFGLLELAVAAPLVAVYGSVLLLCVGLATAAGLAGALLVDLWRNPRWMALRAVSDGREVLLFASRDARVFEQVRRAVNRAVAADEPLRS